MRTLALKLSYSMQILQVIGNIGQDAVVKDLNGQKFITFRVAVTEKFTSNGQQQTQTMWYSITWNRPDSALLAYLQKGAKVFISGKPRYTLYDSAVHRCKMIDVGIMANTIELCGGGEREVKQAQQPATQPEAPQPEADNGVMIF